MAVKSVAIAVIFLIIGYGISFLLPSDFINADTRKTLLPNVSANAGEIIQRGLLSSEGENGTPLTDGRFQRTRASCSRIHLQDHDHISSWRPRDVWFRLILR